MQQRHRRLDERAHPTVELSHRGPEPVVIGGPLVHGVEAVVVRVDEVEDLLTIPMTLGELAVVVAERRLTAASDRKSTRLNSSH